MAGGERSGAQEPGAGGAAAAGARTPALDVWDQPATLRLVRSPEPDVVPRLDPDQQAVVAHRGVPLLVLAGPGTGKTTTLVEAMLDRLSGSSALTPDQVLGLTFGRAAADEWRQRVALRLGGQPPTVTTFHACAFALLRRFPEIVHLAGPPRLLAGYEEQTVVREVVAAALRLSRIAFPDNLRIAALTAEFGRQLRAVMARARGAGVSADLLKEQAAEAGDAAWQLAAELFATYEEYLEASDSFDYASLIVTATAIAREPSVQRQLHGTYRAVFVDEYQDTDPAQVAFLRALVGPGCDLVVVGDPDQSIYAFRGTDVRGILNFVDDFSAPGRPARVAVLRTCRRFPQRIRALADVCLARVNYAGTSWWASVRDQHRAPTCTGPDHDGPVAELLLCADARIEATEVAEQARRLAQQGHAYSSMAVLVRNAAQITPILRQLVAAGVPATARGDESPVATNAAVIALMDAIVVAERPESATPAQAEALLRSPLCGVDPVQLRSLLRALRDAERADDPQREPTSSAQLLVALLVDVRTLTRVAPGIAPAAQQRIRDWHAVLTAAHDEIARGATPEQVLWRVWSAASGWAQRLQNRSLRGGSIGRRADRDLDAVLALFDMASKAARTAAKTCTRFVEEVRQQVVGVIPSDSAAVVDQVSVMTAHRAKGLEWDHVFVVGVQEGVWPNTRLRGAMLGADRVTADGLGPGLQYPELAAEERRLFYVAVTRARRRLWISAVAPVNPGADDGLPSVLLRELLDQADPGQSLLSGVVVRQVHGRRAGALSLPDVAARLRSVVMDDSETHTRRAAAAAQYARLMEVPGVASPSQWWGVRARTHSDAPVRDEGPMYLSASNIDRITTCPLSWFLEREAAARSPKTTVLAFGLVVHAVCEFAVAAQSPPSETEIATLIDGVWSDMGYAAGWVARRERVMAAAAVHRFLLWHQGQAADGWSVHGVETPFNAPIEVVGADGRSHRVTLHGRMDRVEVRVEEDGASVVVYDFKTSRSAPQPAEVREHLQLMTYRRAVAAGGVEGVDAGSRVDAGLVLVNLSDSDSAKAMLQGTPAADIDEVIATVAGVVRDEVFTARPGEHCTWCRLQVACPAKVRADGAGEDDGGGPVADER